MQSAAWTCSGKRTKGHRNGLTVYRRSLMTSNRARVSEMIRTARSATFTEDSHEQNQYKYSLDHCGAESQQ